MKYLKTAVTSLLATSIVFPTGRFTMTGESSTYPDEMGQLSPEMSRTGLSELARRLYAYAVTRPEFTGEELATALGLAPKEAEEAVSELIALRLLQPALASEGRLTCVSPESAADLLTVSLEREVRERQRVIGKIRAQMQSLNRDYKAGMRNRRRSQAVEVLSSDSVSDIIGNSSQTCTLHVAVSQPGGIADPHSLTVAPLCYEEILQRRVAVRVLYQHAACYHPPTAAHAARLIGLGAQVRTSGDRLWRMIIFDRNLAIMEVLDAPHSAVLVHEPHIVDFMTASFDRAWITADPFSIVRTDALSGELNQLVVRLLAEGLSDKVIARRLGVAERTCQRYVRSVMSHLGAKSRFQAGYLVGTSLASGHTREWGSPPPHDRRGGS